MNNKINVRALCTGVWTSEPIARERSHDFLSDTSANASGSILYLYERMNARRCKMSFLCNTLWVGAGAIIGDGNRKSRDSRAPMIWDNVSIFRTNCPILTS